MIMHLKSTDWVHVYRSEFPHIVSINHRAYLVSYVHSWLETHIGPRAHVWQYPTSDTYMFKHAEHAAELAMRFT